MNKITDQDVINNLRAMPDQQKVNMAIQANLSGLNIENDIVPAITNITNFVIEITETIVNKNYGSSFDKWIELGGLPLESKNDIEYLKAVSVPRIQKKMLSTQNNSLTITAELEPHEVRFIEIKPL